MMTHVTNISLEKIGKRVVTIKLAPDGRNLNGCTGDLYCMNAPSHKASFQTSGSDQTFQWLACEKHAHVRYFRDMKPLHLEFSRLTLDEYHQHNLLDTTTLM